MPDAASVLIGPAEIALTRMCLLAEIGGQIAHRGFEGGLGNAHHIVMRHPFLGAVIGEGQHRAAVSHQLLGALGDGGEGIAGDEQRLREIFRRGIDIAAGQFVLVGKGDAVDDEVQASPTVCRLPAKAASRVGGSVTSQWPRTCASSSCASGRTRFSSDSPWKVSASSAPALARGFGDAPGDRPRLGHAHDEPALTGEDAGGRLGRGHFYSRAWIAWP